MTFVQRVSQVSLTSASSQTVPITNAPTAGNRLILSCKFSTSHTVTAVTDTKGNTWVADMVGTAGTARNSIYSTPQDVATLTTSDTLTVTLASAASGAVVIDEYSGLQGGTSGYLDGTPADTGSSSSGTISSPAPSITTSVNGSMLYSSLATSNSSGTITSAPSGFTDRGYFNGSGSVDSADQVATAGTYSASWTWSVSGAWDTSILAYLASSGANLTRFASDTSASADSATAGVVLGRTASDISLSSGVATGPSSAMLPPPILEPTEVAVPAYGAAGQVPAYASQGVLVAYAAAEVVPSYATAGRIPAYSTDVPVGYESAVVIPAGTAP